MSFPTILELNNECSATEIAKDIGLPIDKIEAVFIDGIAMQLDEAQVKPGDRVGFIPYGVPGPYRVLLGIKKI